MRLIVLFASFPIVMAVLLVSLSDGGVDAPYAVPMEQAVTKSTQNQSITSLPLKASKQQRSAEKRPERLQSRDSRPIHSYAPSVEATRFNEQAQDAVAFGEIADALELFEAALTIDPNYAEAHSSYGRLLTRMAVYKKALPHLKRAAELRPENPQVWLDLQTLYERTLLLGRAYDVHNQAEDLVGSQQIIKNKQGFWVLVSEAPNEPVYGN